MDLLTVDVAAARPDPPTRTQTFASRLDTSSPAHRRCTSSISDPLLDPANDQQVSTPGGKEDPEV